MSNLSGLYKFHLLQELAAELGLELKYDYPNGGLVLYNGPKAIQKSIILDVTWGYLKALKDMKDMKINDIFA